MKFDPKSKFKYQIITKYAVVETLTEDELMDSPELSETIEYLQDVYEFQLRKSKKAI